MDLKKWKTSLPAFIKKNRYVVLIFVIGLVFLLIPGKKSSSKTETTASVTQPAEKSSSMNESLAEILGKIDGAGKVQVLLTLAAGEETVYQTDVHTNVSDSSDTSQIDTVVISNADRDQNGLIRQINPPLYMGAIIVCEGADSATVRLAIVDAVSKVTGLGSDRISVLKMK